MKRIAVIALVILLSAGYAHAQSDVEQVKPILAKQLQPPEVVTYQLEEFVLQHAPVLPVPGSSAEWTAQAAQIRRQVLEKMSSWLAAGVAILHPQV